MGLPNIGPMELIIILAIAMLVIGPGKLPEVGSALGKTIRDFKKAVDDVKEPLAPTATPPTKASPVAPTPPASETSEPAQP
jgi:sec-independent protein translocase protein TatA